MEMIEVIMKRF